MARDIAVQQLIANIPSMFCAAIAGTLALFGADGWGWMIFLALCMCVTVGRRKKPDGDSEK